MSLAGGGYRRGAQIVGRELNRAFPAAQDDQGAPDLFEIGSPRGAYPKIATIYSVLGWDGE